MTTFDIYGIMTIGHNVLFKKEDRMEKVVSVAEAKRNFSELMAKVSYKGEEYIIARRGKPMAAIVRPEWLNVINASKKRAKGKGLLGIVGSFKNSQNFVREVEKIYTLRPKIKDRKWNDFK